MVGGRTKYIINGHNAQQQTVQNLFQSVQLNINNPHFLIMQGRITKVLNMKPAEILSMVEEAAGTKMFEDRKTKAIATIAKKERKVEEINKILAEEIMPKLDQLRLEKRVYLDYQKNESEMERLKRLLISYEYKKHEERLNKSSLDNDRKIEEIDNLKKSIQLLQSEIDKLDEDMQSVTNKMKQSGSSSSRIKQLESSIKDYSTQLVRLNTKKGLLETSVTEEQKAISALAAQRGELMENLSEKKASYMSVSKEYEEFKKEYDAKTEEMKSTDELIQTLTTGISAEEGHENGYMEQLQQSKNMVNQASTAEEQASLKIKHLRKELAEKEPQAAKALAESQGSVVALEKKKAEIEELEKHLGTFSWTPDRENELLRRRRQLHDALNDLYDKQEQLSRKLSNLDFQYSLPSPDFDRSQVKGLVAELITLDKENFDASTALEICAGGKLYNVVIENEKVGAQLLDKGKLRRRWTLVPLNKIQGFRVSAEKIATAEKIAPGKVNLALNLIGYDEEVHAAMEWIFGNTFICEDAQTAKDVTFNKGVSVKSVTLDGDVYDPHGTLSGGSKPNSSGILIRIQELNDVKADIRYHKKELDALEDELENAQKYIAEYRQYKQRLDLQRHEISLLEQRMKKSIHAQLASRIESIKEQIAQQEAAREQAKLAKEQAIATCKKIEAEMADFNNNKDTKLNELTTKVEQLKSQLKKNASKLKDMQRTVQTFELEIEQLDADIRTCEEDIEKVKDSIDQYKMQIVEMQQEIDSIESSIAEKKDELKKETQELNARNEELKELSALHTRKSEEVVELNLKVQKLMHDIDRFQKDRQHSRQAVEDLEAQNEWIADEKQYVTQILDLYDILMFL